MKFFALKKINLWLAFEAICLTLLIRFLVYTEDCNLLVMAVAFFAVYFILFITSFVSARLNN